MIQRLYAKEMLLEAAKEVFETMIFMTVEQVSEQCQKIEGQTLLGSITFKGAFEGCLVICCNTSCARAIARNVLVIDTTENLSEEETCDAIAEVVNVVIGWVKGRLQGEFGKYLL